eukprot:2738447-Karenia_brevis.AAC.1
MVVPVKPVNKKFDDDFSRLSKRARTRHKLRDAAWEWTLWLIGAFNFYEVGSPKCPADYRKVG